MFFSSPYGEAAATHDAAAGRFTEGKWGFPEKRIYEKSNDNKGNEDYPVMISLGNLVEKEKQKMSKKWKMKDIKICDANRNISENHKEKLKRLIEKYGYFEGAPIVVDSDGNIIDGQHRFIACKELGMEPPIIEYKSFDIVPHLNSSQLRWGIKDYVKYHSAKGIEDYAILEQICKSKKISANIAVNCITEKCVERAGLAKHKEGYTNPIKDGTFVIPDKSDKGLAKLDRKIDAILRLVSELGLPKTDRLIVAICRLAENKNFSFKLMSEKIAYQRARIYRCSTIQEYANMLANIYNNKNRNKIVV